MQADVLTIGSGIAGAAAALPLAEDRQRQVTVHTRAREPRESKDHYARGGIVGRGLDDSAQLPSRTCSSQAPASAIRRRWRPWLRRAQGW